MTTDFEADDFDVAVVGAGPAGSATARYLALRGWRVALLERTRFGTPRVGESLAPNIQEPLRALGLWSEFLALAPLPSWGTRSLWGDATQQSHSHLLNPYGCGWHVDRRAFDCMLAHAAAAAGASLFEGMAMQRNVRHEGCWRLQVTPGALDGERLPRSLRARLLIDATGRQAQVARALGAQRILLDRLVGLAVRWAAVDASEKDNLLVEAAPEGWWYSAPLPGGTQDNVDAMIAMLMTDADLCGRLRLARSDRWQAALRRSHATRRRLGQAQCRSAPQVHCANSQRLRRDGASNVGPWLAVGDAALAVDPISGSGVLRALRTARAAADAVNEMLAHPHAWHETIAAYEAARDDECTSYLLERADYYAAEQRFNTPFWQRRRVLRSLVEAADKTLIALAR